MRLMSLLTAVLLLALLASATAADDGPPAAKKVPAKKAGTNALPTLPKAWLGIWKGPCTVAGPTRKRLDFPMELHVAPIEDRDAWTWRIVYGEGAKRQVRNYELLPVAGGKGHFRVDEKNGIVIDSWLHGDTLYSRFEVGAVSIDARYTLTKQGKLAVSLVTTRVAPSATTGGKDGVPAVRAFPFVALQSGVLTKQAK